MAQLSALYSRLFSQTLNDAQIFIVIAMGYAITLSVIAVLRQRKILEKEHVRFVNWMFALLILHQFRISIRNEHDSDFFNNALILLEFIFAWMVIKHFINEFVAEFYLKKIKKINVKSITLDLYKSIFLLILLFAFLKIFFNIEINSIFTSSIVITAIIGISMQDIIGSFVSGILIQIEKPFKIGDWICLKDQEGKVVETSWRYTKIETIQKFFIVIPNNSISKEVFINYSDPTPVLSRKFALGVSFEVPPVRVKEAVMAVLSRSSHVLHNPAPKVRMMEYSDSNIVYHIFYFIRQFDHMLNAIDEIHSGIWYEFKKQGITVSFPIRTVFMPKKNEIDLPIKIINLLKEIDLFEGMSDEDLHLLVRSSDVQEFAPDSTIISRGGLDTTLFVILEGTVSVRQNGQEFALLEAGAFFGEMAMLTGEPRSADLVAVDRTVCLVIDREGFKGLLEKRRRIIRNVNEIFRKRRSEMAPDDLLPKTYVVEPKNLFARFKKIFLLE